LTLTVDRFVTFQHSDSPVGKMDCKLGDWVSLPEDEVGGQRYET